MILGSSNGRKDTKTNAGAEHASNAGEDLPTHNPVFDIKEVLQMILSNVPSTTLRNCRLVSQHWNSNTLEVMKNSGWVTQIVGTQGPRGILEFVDQIESSKPPTSKLNLSITLGGEEQESPITPQHLSQGLNALGTLSSLLGPNCVHSFKFFCPADCETCWNNEMLGSLHYISPGLKRLVIKEEESGLLASPPLPTAPLTYFPALLEFTYHPVGGNAHILPWIVNTSPQLEKLTIITWRPYAEVLGVYYLARIPALLNEITSAFAHLQELNIPLSSTDSYEALERLRFPALQKLHLAILDSTYEAVESILASFLAKNCPKLDSLVLQLNTLEEHPRLPAGLPQLPQLTHLGLFVANHTPVFIEVDKWSPVQFENLTSVTVHFGQFLYQRNNNGDDVVEVEEEEEEEEEEMDNGEEVEVCEEEEVEEYQLIPGLPANWSVTKNMFNQVHKLHLIIDEYWDWESTNYEGAEVTHHECSRHLCALFPALQELIVDVQIPKNQLLRKEDPKIEHVLQALLGAKIGNGIEHLEIRNYVCDWLSVLFWDSSAVRRSLSGLKSLTIPPITKEYRNLVDSSTIPAGKNVLTLCVPFLMAHVPGLERLKVHDLFLRPKAPKGAADDHGRDIQEILEEFQLAYPGLTIELF